MSEFTVLETAVLDAIVRDHPDFGAALEDALATARVTDRDNTGHGFFTSFATDRTLAPVATPDRIVDGPNLEVQARDQVLLMGFILFVHDGRPDCLEGFQYGIKDTGADFDLRDDGLLGLSVLGPALSGEWFPQAKRKTVPWIPYRIAAAGVILVTLAALANFWITGSVVVFDKGGHVLTAVVTHSGGVIQPLRRLPGGIFYGTPKGDGAIQIRCHDGESEGGYVTVGSHTWMQVPRMNSCLIVPLG